MGKKKNHQDFYKPWCYNELPQALKIPATFHLRFAIRCVFAFPRFQFTVHYPARLSSPRMFAMEFIMNLYFKLSSCA